MKVIQKILIGFLICLFLFVMVNPKNTVFAQTYPPGCGFVDMGGIGACPRWKPIPCLNPYICCETAEQCAAVPVPTDMKGVDVLCNGDTKCQECVYVSNSSTVTGLSWTAFGCVPTNDFNGFVGWLLSKLIFIASGVAFLLMVLGAIQILTSAGNPDKVKAGKELITSALSGLLLVILSIFLLKLIGVDILHIPGL